MANLFFRLAAKLRLEGPAQRRGFAQMIMRLEESGQKLNARAAKASDSQLNRRQIRHIIGIERWSQRRLRTFLGEPPTLDEYDSYQPPAEQSWADYQAALRQTRAETVALARQLQAAQVDGAKVAHNSFGDLTALGWLQYLLGHADREATLLR
jgi:hypothetical protein